MIRIYNNSKFKIQNSKLKKINPFSFTMSKKITTFAN